MLQAREFLTRETRNFVNGDSFKLTLEENQKSLAISDSWPFSSNTWWLVSWERTKGSSSCDC
jgi:hypothetical protein